MADIIAGLFGLSPSDVQAQQRQGINQFAMQQAQMSPQERGLFNIGAAGGNLATLGANAFGFQNQDVIDARNREAVLGQLDMSTPQGILQAAEIARQKGDVRMQLQLQQLAQQKQAEMTAAQYAANKDAREETKVDRDAVWKHEEKLAEIQQRADAAKLRSEDARISAEERAAAAKRHDELMVKMAQMAASAKVQAAQIAASVSGVGAGGKLTPGQKKMDENFAQEYVDFTSKGGYAEAQANIGELDRIIKVLDKPGSKASGGLIGALPDAALRQVNEEAANIKQSVASVVQNSLKPILGTQFTQVEGENLIKRSYDPMATPAENARRLKVILYKAKEAAAAKADASAYFKENGTLRGWEGKIPTVSDFTNMRFDSAPANPSSAASADGWGIRKK